MVSINYSDMRLNNYNMLSDFSWTFYVDTEKRKNTWKPFVEKTVILSNITRFYRSYFIGMAHQYYNIYLNLIFILISLDFIILTMQLCDNWVY